MKFAVSVCIIGLPLTAKADNFCSVDSNVSSVFTPGNNDGWDTYNADSSGVPSGHDDGGLGREYYDVNGTLGNHGNGVDGVPKAFSGYVEQYDPANFPKRPGMRQRTFWLI